MGGTIEATVSIKLYLNIGSILRPGFIEIKVFNKPSARFWIQPLIGQYQSGGLYWKQLLLIWSCSGRNMRDFKYDYRKLQDINTVEEDTII